MKALILATLFFFLGLFPAISQTNFIQGIKYTPEEPIEILDENISEYTLFTADIEKSNFNITGKQSIVTLDLETQKYEFNLYNDNLVLRYESNNKPLLLGGSLRFGGTVSLTINDDFIYGYIKYGHTHLFIEPVRHLSKDAPRDLYVIYNARDVLQTGEHICGVTETSNKTNEFRYKLPTTMCKIIDFGIANTYDMVTALGTVTDVQNHNLAVLNNVQSNYRSEFDTNLEFEVVSHFVPASSGADPFTGTTNANSLLTQLSNWGDGGNNNGGASGGFGVDYHRASLWTDRDIQSGGNSSVVGLAQTPGGHNVLENYSTSAGNLMSLQSHELGHNFDAVSSSSTFHDSPTSATIMAPSVVITPDWSSASKSDIDAHVATMTYLSDCSTVSAPNADFFKSSITVCPTFDIEYEDQSQYGATRSWNFFGGTPSTGTDEKETVTYNNTGLLATKIVSSNTAGQDSVFQYVDIQSEPSINCVPSNPGGSGTYAGITFFALENISNSSPGSSATIEYTNYICSQVAVLDENTSYDFAVSVGDCSAPQVFERIRIYIDYNGDGDLDDSGESVFYTGGTSYCGLVTGSFTTPASPTLATMLRLRVIADNSSINSPCHDPSSGEVEDYGVYFEDVQVFGCTDPAASNHDPNATVDDGSCSYGGTIWYADTDNDTFGDPNNTTTSGSQPAGYVADNTDCDDTDGTVYPGAAELCDGQINDCNTGTLPGDEVDNDGDNYVECTIDAGGWDGPPSIIGGDDCNDNDSSINPGATEICDNIDNDCDGQIDEGVQETYYRDFDNDAFGDPNNSTLACSLPAGYVANNLDCNDNDDTVYPTAPELCDGQINNCNVSNLSGDEIDNDGDGYVECTIDAGGWDGPPSVIGGDDCDDNDSTAYPGATEICDGVDNDCDGQTDEGIVNQTYYRDLDGDNYGDNSNSILDCIQPPGYVLDNTDCNDNDSSINPGATEVCDGVDNNCDGQTDEGLTQTYYRDFDGDTYGDNNTTTQACSQPAGYVLDNTDCDDNNSAVYPGATEICDGVDNDCDGQVDEPCQPCDGDFLVINTVTQNTYRAEISITSDATIDLGSDVLFTAGSEIQIDPNFEVISGQVFEMTIEDCIPIMMVKVDDSQQLNSADIEELHKNLKDLLGSGIIKIQALDRWGNIIDQSSALLSELEAAMDEMVFRLDAGLYMLLIEQGDKKFTQQIAIK